MNICNKWPTVTYEESHIVWNTFVLNFRVLIPVFSITATALNSRHYTSILKCVAF